LQPAPSLPIEIIIDILSSIDNTPTLAACALTSHTFHDLAIPFLYHTVVLSGASFGFSNHDDYITFFHGILEFSAASQGARTRKVAYLRHLKELVLKTPPIREWAFTTSSSEDLFPSLRYIEFGHYDAVRFKHIFSHFLNIRHVCVCHDWEVLYNPRMVPVFDTWTNVERLTLRDWYPKSWDFMTSRTIPFGIPLAWTNLKQITVYPALEVAHGILRIRPIPPPSGLVPSPFMFMPHSTRFPLLKKFMIMIPAIIGWRDDWDRYEEYTEKLQEGQKALVEKVIMETKNNMWP